jgi:hypothetical protein
MEREQAHVGMRVVFGRADAEQTLGRIIKINPARAKVESLEPRAGRPAGTRFNVPYDLLMPADDEQAPAS